MKCIVPIAGKDYFKDGKCKGLINTDSGPLLLSILNSRAWIKHLKDIIFVVLDSELSRDFSQKYLKKWFPFCKVIFIPSTTSGAALSLLSGMSNACNINNEPILVDLADIKFTNKFVPYLNNEKYAYAFTFSSKKDCYSYFSTDSNGLVNEAKEKQVISEHASAGVYAFPSCSTLLKSIAYALENPQKVIFKNLFYVSPLFNYLIESNIDVKITKVQNVIDYKFVG